MERILLLDEIQFPSTLKHILSKPKKIFPFLTKNTSQIKGNFHIVISDLARSITGYQLDLKKLNQLQYHYVENSNKLSEFIANSTKIDFQNDIAKIDFIRFMDSYLFNGDKINIIHTYLYNFIGERDMNQSILHNISKFIKDILIAQDEQIEFIFKNRETDNVLTELIISEIDNLVVNKNPEQDEIYSDILPEFTNIFRDDLKFLIKHKDYLINNLEIFLNYYTFMYSIQCLLKFEKFIDGKYFETQPLYFALDWEAVTKKRSVASNLLGYKLIKEYAPNLFAHEYVLRLLSHNKFNLSESGKDVVCYTSLIEQIESHGQEYVEQFKQDLKDLIQLYINWLDKLGRLSKENKEIKLADTVENLLNQLFKFVKNGMHDDAQLKFGQSIDYLGQGAFLKSRGNLGYLLNMSHDFLILMTSIIVKDKRMPFKTLLEEFEKRGIKFDRYSNEEIISLFNSHNMLEKKSDSGDVQYVKSIL